MAQVVSEYMLGSYDATASDANTVHTDSSDVSGGAKFVSQQYTGGEPCELTGQPRSAEVGAPRSRLPCCLSSLPSGIGSSHCSCEASVCCRCRAA